MKISWYDSAKLFYTFGNQMILPDTYMLVINWNILYNILIWSIFIEIHVNAQRWKKQLFQEKQTTSRIIKETQCNFPSLLL